MAKKSTVGIRTPEGDLNMSLLKAFSSGWQWVVLLGDEFDDHSVWELAPQGLKARLLGTLKRDEWDSVRRVRRGGEWKLLAEVQAGSVLGFDFVPVSSKGKEISLRCVDAATVDPLEGYVSDDSAIGD